MFLILRKKNLIIFVFFFYLFNFCIAQDYKNSLRDSPNNFFSNQWIDLTNLRVNLLKADRKLTPKLIRNDDGSSFYNYLKRPGESEISLEEIKERISLGSDFYKNDREEVINLLKRINELKINNKLEHIDNGALGLWNPGKDTIFIDYRVIDMGSQTFLNVLSHEVIHVAQSCFSGSRKNFPERIGLPLCFMAAVNQYDG